MRRILLVLTALVLLGGAAQAQQWAGVRTGYPLGVTLHYGTSLDAFDLRISGRVVARGDSVRFGVAFEFGLEGRRTDEPGGNVVPSGTVENAGAFDVGETPLSSGQEGMKTFSNGVCSTILPL